jgi:3-hydroxyacyl-CoA dehydrogenase
MKTIAVIRRGTMGNGIAHATLLKVDFTVKLIDVSEQSLNGVWLLYRKFRSNDRKERSPRKIKPKQ